MGNIKEAIFSWWLSISQREQRMVIICAVLLLLGGLYWGIIQPVTERAELAERRINSEKQLLQWVSEKADSIVELRGSTGIKTSTEPLNQVVSASAATYKIELIRIQPRDDMLQVWVKPVIFDQLIHWLAYLQNSKGIQVEFMDISSSEVKGVVEVKRLQLKRGG